MSEQQPQMPDLMKMVSGFLPFIILWGFNKLDLPKDDPVVIWTIRAIFIASQALYFGMIYLLEQKIIANKKKNDKTLVYVVKNPEKSPMDDKAEPYVYAVKQQYEYDLEQVAAMKSYMGIVITLALHIYFGFLPALIIQAITTPLKFFESKITKMYFFGVECERPFVPEPSPFGALLGQKSEQELMDEWDAEQTKKGKKPSNKEQLLLATKNDKKQKQQQKEDSSSASDGEAASEEVSEAPPQQQQKTSKKKTKKVD